MIIDSPAIIAILKGRTDAPGIAACLAGATRPAVSAANRTGAAIVAGGDRGNRRGDFDGLSATFGIDVVPATRELAAGARDAWRRSGRGNHPARLNPGDGFAGARARARNGPLLFRGGDFARANIEPALKTD